MTVAQIIERIIHRIGRKAFAGYGEVLLLETMNDLYARINDEYGLLERFWNATFADSDQKLTYKNLIGNPTVGLVVTGATSGATGTIVEVIETSTTEGYFLLSGVVSIFQKETVTFTGGSATATDIKSGGYIALPADLIRPFRISLYLTYREPQIFSEKAQKTFTIMNRRFYVSGATNDSVYSVNYFSVGKTLVRTVTAAATQTASPEWPSWLHQLLVYETCLEISPDYSLRPLDVVNALKLRSQLHRSKYMKQESTPGAYNPYSEQRMPVSIDDFGIAEYLG